MRALSALLTESGASFDRRLYLESKAGGVVQAYSRSSAQLGVDAGPVAAFIAAEARGVLARRPELSGDEPVRRRLAVAALLRFMTLHDSPRRWLIRPDDDALRLFCEDAGLEADLAEPEPPDGAASPIPVDPRPRPDALLAIDCPLDAVARSIAATGLPPKGIALSASTSPDARTAFRQVLPADAEEIATGVDLGSGLVAAWIWAGR